MKCAICGIELKFLNKHLENVHNMTQKEYYDTYLKKPYEGKCLHCGKPVPFIKLSKGYKEYCNRICKSNSELVKCKTKNTCLEKYGVENPYQTDHAKQCSAKAKSKAIQTLKTHLQQKYGIENIWQCPDIICKMKQKRFERAIEFEKSHDVVSMKTLVNLYGEGWKQSKALNIPRIYDNHAAFIDKQYIPKIIEYYNDHNKGCASYYEFELVKAIDEIYFGKILKRRRTIIPPKELDIYLPDIKLAIDFNGNYWHRHRAEEDKYYHLNKSIMCRSNGIRLVHIYQFEDFEKQKQLLIDLINGIDNYPKNDFNKNNFGSIPEGPEIICTSPYIIYGAGKLL